MERRVTTRDEAGGGRRGGFMGTALFLGTSLLLGGSPLPGPAPASAQERIRAEECRCVDAEGNRIENCTCIIRPDVDAFARVWSLAPANRARIGITVSSQQEAGFDRDGAHVESVLEGGPADEAGLREGDVIVRVNGRSLFQPLDDPEAEEELELDRSAPVQRLLSLLSELDPGDEVEVEYVRDGETRRAVIEAEENPARFGSTVRILDPQGEGLAFERGQGLRGFVTPEGARAFHFNFPEGETNLRLDSLRAMEDREFPRALFGRTDPCFSGNAGPSGSLYVLGSNCIDGVELTALNPDLGEYFGTDEGLLVTEVREGSTLGLQPGDVLQAIDGREVEDASQARRILRSYEDDEELTLRIVRKGESMEIQGRRR